MMRSITARWFGLRKACVAAVVAAGLGVAATPASAITQVTGYIEQSGTEATIDYWFFDLAVDATTGIQADPRAFMVAVLTEEDTGLSVYENDGAGGIGTFLGSAGTGGAGSNNARIELALTAGSYIVAVSAFELLDGELGATQIDPNISLPMDYELTLDLAGGNDSIFTCAIEGDLGGGFTRTTFTAGANCQIPGTAVPEPMAMGLLGAGAAALGLARRRRKG